MNAHNESIENQTTLSLEFDKLKNVNNMHIIPAVVQSIDNKEVLLVGYVNQIALEYSIKHQIACFWSTSRNQLWIKGKTSNQYLKLHEIRVNCEQNSLLYLVSITDQGACHTKDQNNKYRKSCFYRKLDKAQKLKFL